MEYNVSADMHVTEHRRQHLSSRYNQVFFLLVNMYQNTRRHRSLGGVVNAEKIFNKSLISRFH